MPVQIFCHFMAHTHTHVLKFMSACLCIYVWVCMCVLVFVATHIFLVFSVFAVRGHFRLLYEKPFAIWRFFRVQPARNFIAMRIFAIIQYQHTPLSPYLHLHWSRQCPLSPTIRLTLNCLWQIESTVQRAEKML